MTTRRKITLRTYDYLHGLNLVTARLAEMGEPTMLSPFESHCVSVAVEACADHGFTNDQAEQTMRDTANEIIADRKRVLFPAFDPRDNMGDEAACAQADGVAA